MFTNAQTQWVDRFVMKLGSLGMPGQADQLQRLACELYPDLNTVPPEDVAQVEWEECSHEH
jgi:hypothetical protein